MDKKRKREMLAEAALEVFCEKGFHATRMADIAERAKVGKGTLYEYFRNKREILEYIFRDFHRSFFEGVARSVLRGKSFTEKLKALIDSALEHVGQWEKQCSIYIDYMVTVKNEPEGPFSMGFIYEETRAFLEEMIKEGMKHGEIAQDLDAGALAEIMISVYEGIIVSNIFYKRQVHLSLIRENLKKVFVRGLVPSR